MPAVNDFDNSAYWGGGSLTTYSGYEYKLSCDPVTPTDHWGGFLLNPLDEKRCFVVRLNNGTYQHPYYFGVSNDKTIGGSLGIPGVHSGMYGIGNSDYDNSTNETSLQSFSPSGKTAFTGSLSRLGYWEIFSVYVDPVTGSAWVCNGSYGFDSTETTEGNDGYCIGGGNPITGTSPTFTFPTTGSWYLDSRASALSEDTADSASGYVHYYFDPDDTSVVDYDTDWPSAAKTGYTVGWKEVVDNIGTSTGFDPPITPVYLSSVDNIFVGTGVLGPWYDQELDDMTDIGTECGISLPFGYPYVNAPDTAVVSMILRAFEMEAYFGAKAEFNLKPLYVSSIIEKDINLIGSMSLRPLRIEATAKTDRDVNVTMTFKGLKVNATMTKDKLIQGVLTLSALRTSAVMYEISTTEGTFTLRPFELDAIGIQEIEHFVMRYER